MSAERIPRPDGRPVVQVECIEDLVRLAKLHQQFIVHADENAGHRFALFTDTVMYVYDVGTTDHAESTPNEVESPAATLARLERSAAERRPTPPETRSSAVVRNPLAAATLESMLQG